MTEDDDRVAYLAGEGADIDEVTRADLDDLRSLLADEALWAMPPDGIEDDVVAAITAEAAARPAGVAGGEPATGRVPPERATHGPATVTPLAGRRRRAMRIALTAAAAVIALAVAGVVVLRGGDNATEFSVALEATELAPDASGSARLRQTDSGWRIELDATGLPRLDDGRFYEAWLRNADGVLVPIGTFNEGADVVLWAGVSPVDFSTLTITEESADGDQASSGNRVLVGAVELP